ncbi:DNA polymerase III subunit chi [Asticcacaulis sp. AC402]|uniref:DNA polymerase III subunit chi n=1 Tax=Asticcacaulis sp. AC402 TaxID=1282361 RepID=UPI0003C3D2C9|nr:DNA polymerase III subunit chi [Asticcacaulis sp. AC402]ESQ73452.1 DNA polymerase III subunit chi [Asticcacaulis sp. AC402]
MPDIWFYHLETTPLDQALPGLLEKVAQKGWRAYVHGHEDDKITVLNDGLWTYRADSFLAHGREGDELETRQPVLLGTTGAMANKPQVYLSVAPVDLPDLSGLERCIIVFDGNDDEHRNWARTQWKALKAAGGDLAYWKQNDRGRWEKVQ